MSAVEEPRTESDLERPARIDRVTLPVLDGIQFGTRTDGGYEPEEVDALIRDLKQVLEAADGERTALRVDLAHLKDQLAEQGKSEITVDAVGLLSQAQVIADKCIADAETYARDLMMTARSQYREVLERAEKSAAEAADKVSEAAPETAPAQQHQQESVPVQPVPEVEYVRTYARVAQVQLRAVLDALAEQVDMLGRLPESNQGGDAGQTRAASPHVGAPTNDRPGPGYQDVNHAMGPDQSGQTGWPGDHTSGAEANQSRSYGDVVWEHQGAS